jgi:hypothetical protein
MAGKRELMVKTVETVFNITGRSPMETGVDSKTFDIQRDES